MPLYENFDAFIHGLTYISHGMSETIRIALIDDDDAIRESIADILSAEGYQVLLYANGRDALEGLLKEDSPDVILCDLMMPIMNGWQFLDAQEQSAGTLSKIPVVVLSATPDPGTFVHSTVQEVVAKPIDIDALVDLVERHTGRPEAS